MEGKYALLKERLEVKYLRNSAYATVMLSKLFEGLPKEPGMPALTGETFCRVFGTPQTSLEMFLLQQKIKGPGWLDISGAVPVSAQVSWCRLEATVAAPSQVKE